MYFRLSISGTLFASEKWSVNPCFHFNAAIAPVWDQASGDAIVAALGALPAPPAGLLTPLGAGGRLSGFRLEGRDEDESLLGVSELSFPPGVAGTGTTTKSSQDSLVLSLRTDTPGASGRGRLYWPALGATLDSTSGKLSSPTPATAASAAVTYLTSIQEAIEDNAGVFPFTSVLLGVRSTTQHVTRTVNRIQVGDVLDTQRRRRDAFVETYASAVYP